LLLTGQDPFHLEAAQLINVCYSMIVSDVMNIEITRTEARETINKRLDEIVQADMIRRNIKVEPEPFKLTPAMMAQMGIKINPKPAKDGE
jgi:hypothetical protein